MAPSVPDARATEFGQESLKPWSDLQHLSDNALIGLYRESKLDLVADPHPLANTSVRLIGRDTVIKFPSISPSEADTLRLVKASTTIPVPSVRRFIPGDRPDANYLVMELIPGRTLEACWRQLSLWRKFVVVWTLRGYVRQLRRVPFQAARHELRPGPVGEEPQECNGLFFTDYGAGPFLTYGDLVEWFTHKLNVAQRMKKAPPTATPFDQSLPLVLTHYDLAPRNLVLDNNNNLWVLDWGFTGFYPKWFEYAAMAFAWEQLGWYGRLMAQLIAGFYEKQRRFFSDISWALTTGVMM
ncbi:hypothetical protein OBBRIDRAFT_813878 [Obba rivulosa]|uniref:Aminoglycoside phosphotransferase domain-containing protein n=1 Tax=Obba rivulosa TaxID=1052685 RepID=A0A8E2DJK7_9APHY|nr:hypothetical protein OBBRIDRAFT_813878 [Obba rivulosa]